MECNYRESTFSVSVSYNYSFVHKVHSQIYMLRVSLCQIINLSQFPFEHPSRLSKTRIRESSVSLTTNVNKPSRFILDGTNGSLFRFVTVIYLWARR